MHRPGGQGPPAREAGLPAIMGGMAVLTCLDAVLREKDALTW
jgi:hypothetical protein